PASPIDEYIDSGATCNDALDGPLSHAVEVSGHVVDLSQPDTYTIQYDCADLADNHADPVTRTVTVQDTLPPIITTLEDIFLAEDSVIHMNGLNLVDHVSDQIYAATDIEFRISNFLEIPTGFGLTIGMDSGSGNFTDRSDNTIHVHPANDFNGSTTVMIQARDPAGNVSQTKSFTLTISPANDAPVAVPDSLTVAQGESTTVLDSGAASVLDNDMDDGDSGLAPVLDANQINWHSFHNLTPDQFADDWDQRKDANFLIDIEIDQIDGQKLLSGVWQHNPDDRLWAEFHDLTEIQFYQLWSQYLESGYRLIDQESYLLGNQRYYAGIWLENPEEYTWISHLNSTSTQFSESFEQYKHSYLPSDLDAYTVDGETRYAHLWVENTELLNWILLRDMTTASFANYTSKYAKFYRVHDVESYQVNGQQLYAAIWIENRNDRSWQHERDLNMNSYQNHWRHYRDLGYRLTDFEKYETGEGERYAGVWRQNTTRPDWHLRASIDETATEHLAEHDIPGMSVAIVQQGEIKYMRGFGYQDVAGDQWYSAQTINRLASVSKAIGGVLLLKLADQGQLDPAALTSMYVPQIPAHHTHTLAELTSNRGGVGHYSQLGLGTLYTQYDTATEASALFWDKDLVSSPGSSYFYSTHGYTLLGAGIEGATGQAIDDVLYNELGSGLGLTTLKAEDRSVSNEFRTKLYNTNNTEASPDNISWKILGGGVEASAYDLARFSSMLIGGEILSNESLQQLWTVPEPDNVSYAMGWTVGTQQGEFAIRKDGSQLGANTYLRLFPDLNLGIVVLSNRRYSEPGTLSYNIANAILNSEAPDPSDIVPEQPSLTASLVTDVTHGSLVFNSDGTFSYTHDGSEITQDSFTYQAHDGLLDSNIVTVTITVEPDNPLPVTITGTKYNDLNGNGQRDQNEPGLPGWTIQLSDANGQLATTSTDPDGNYSFTNLEPGTFTVSEQQQAGWVQTAPASPGTFTLVTSSGQDMDGLDFGNRANHPPVITSNGGGATAILITPENQTDLTTITSTDADSHDTHHYSLSGGTDQGLFVINTATGILSFEQAPLFEAPADANTDNRYEVQVTVTDSGGLTDNQAITVIVTPHPKSTVWDGEGTVGTVGDGASWSDPNNWSWTEGGIDDLAPNDVAPGDNIIFKASPSVGAIDLQASRTINSLSLEADYQLENHALTITSGMITVGGAEVTASIASDILSPAGITKTGAGTLVVTASAPAVEIAAGTFILGSSATTNDLTVGSDTLAILNGSVNGDVINSGTLRVIGTAASLPLDTGSSTSQDPVGEQSTWASGIVIVVPVAQLRNAAIPDDREQSNVEHHFDPLSLLLTKNEPTVGRRSTGTVQQRQADTHYSFGERVEKPRKDLEVIDQLFRSGWDQLG
ncbi:MAG: serine hydrolase, partial [Pirellulaceae bacterium]|nr:serine hydrolase [Pirellulaceae bacterium]